MRINRRRPSVHDMRARRIAGVLALMLFTASACSNVGAPQSPPASASSQTARQALTAAAEKLPRATYKYTWELRGATNGNNRGHVDPGKATASADIGSFRRDTVTLVQMQVLLTGADLWLLVTQPASADPKWMHAAANYAELDSVLGKLATDPTNIGGWLSAVMDVAYDGTKLRGTVDLTKAPQVGHRAALTGDSAKAAPFTAEHDGDGRLISFIVDFAALTNEAEDRLTMRYFGFGSPLKVSAPPSTEVIELTPALIDMLR